MFPVEFADLERFSAWALPQESQRNKARMASNIDEMREFCSAVIDRVDAIADYLDAKPVADWTVADSRVMSLVFMYLEVGVAIERYQDPMPYTGFDLGRVIARETNRYRPQLPHIGYVPPPLDYREPIPVGTDLREQSEGER